MTRRTIQELTRALHSWGVLTGTDAGHVALLSSMTHDEWAPVILRTAWALLRKHRGHLVARGISLEDVRPPEEEWLSRRLPPRPGVAILYGGGLFKVCVDARVPDRQTLISELLRNVPNCFRGEGASDLDPWIVPAYRPESTDKLCVWGARAGASGLEEVIHQHTERSRRLHASRAADAPVIVPIEHFTLRPYQRAGVRYATRCGSAYLGDGMGLGKSLEALASVECLHAYPCLVLCPASVRGFWDETYSLALPKRRRLTVWKTSDVERLFRDEPEVVICSWDLMRTEEVDAPPRAPGEKAKKGPRRLIGAALAFKKYGFKGFVGDEATYVKNADADRTRATRAIAPGFKHRFLLSGTPTENRPNELVTQLEILGVLDSEFGGAAGFRWRYCAPERTRWGWQFKGSANPDELRQRMRSTFMIRRKRREVEKNLPPVTYGRVVVDISNRSEYDRASEEFLDWLAETEGDEAAERARRAEQIAKMGHLRRLAAQGKLGAIREWVQAFIEAEEKLVLFAHHIELQEALHGAFPGSLWLRGGGAKGEADAVRQKFQTDPKTILLVASLKAGGVGHTFTAASQVALCEPPWTPSAVDQAVGRVDRQGQTRAMNAWSIVARGTIDEEIEALLGQKRKVVEAIVDEDAREKVAQEGVEDEVLRRLRERAAARKSGRENHGNAGILATR